MAVDCAGLAWDQSLGGFLAVVAEAQAASGGPVYVAVEERQTTRAQRSAGLLVVLWCRWLVVMAVSVAGVEVKAEVKVEVEA